MLSLALVSSCTPDSGAEQAGSTSLIELRLVRDVDAPGLHAVEYDGETMYVEPVPVLSDRDLASVEPSVQPGELMLHIRLTPEAAERIASVSSEEIGSRVAIIIDSKVRSAPVIRDRIGHRADIMIGASQEAATRLAAIVRARWP
jgi:preprotein translocase subunit SecD